MIQTKGDSRFVDFRATFFFKVLYLVLLMISLYHNEIVSHKGENRGESRNEEC